MDANLITIDDKWKGDVIDLGYVNNTISHKLILLLPSWWKFASSCIINPKCPIDAMFHELTSRLFNNFKPISCVVTKNIVVWL
jgi:hypothetical protein